MRPATRTTLTPPTPPTSPAVPLLPMKLNYRRRGRSRFVSFFVSIHFNRIHYGDPAKSSRFVRNKRPVRRHRHTLPTWNCTLLGHSLAIVADHFLLLRIHFDDRRRNKLR